MDIRHFSFVRPLYSTLYFAKKKTPEEIIAKNSAVSTGIATVKGNLDKKQLWQHNKIKGFMWN
ncbi:MAG: hypothetical protein R2821_01775 [Flavobacteriaceae bacterium]